ncbi:transcriptional activator somA [Fusarium denticulatum]|uniref:Transcriptional activator somA n=1 Tax=Fusarium denticulatum TaxID=48507 RepID=A0A8H5WU64_9HYPO|nr:transcriptional activator somA [Fusarium denticulatum]
MFPIQQAFPDQMPSNTDYHALLHTQIYDYFLSAGMYSCGQALLNSDYNLRHQVMHTAAQRCTTEPRIPTPSLLDSGFGSSYSSPCEEPYPTEHEHLSRAEAEPALLQWFCTFWDTLNSTQAQATGVPVRDSLSYPPDLTTHPLESEPTIDQDLFSLQSLGTKYPAERHSIDIIEKKKGK